MVKVSNKFGGPIESMLIARLKKKLVQAAERLGSPATHAYIAYALQTKRGLLLVEHSYSE